MRIANQKELGVVLFVAAVVLILTAAGAVNYALAYKQVMATGMEIGGWSVFFRSVVVLVTEGLSAGVALFFILRGTVLAAYNASGVFLTVMLAAALLKGAHLLEAPAWQLFVGVAWLIFLAWLLWRVMPNTSLNPDAAKRSAG